VISGENRFRVSGVRFRVGVGADCPSESIDADAHWFHGLLERDLSGMDWVAQFLARHGSSLRFPLREVQLNDIAGTKRVDSGDNFRLVNPNLRPARRGQHQNRQPPSSKVPLIAQVFVGSNKGFEISFSRLEEGAVVKLRPAHLIGRRNGVISQCATQRRGSSLVKENSHARPAADPMRSRHSQTSLRVPQHKLHLFSRHAGKPLQEVIDSRAVFEVLEQRPDWYASGFEHPFATDFSGYAFNSRTLTPIKHNTILREAGLACKHARKGTKSAPGQVEGFAKARAETRMGSYKSNRDNREQVRSVEGRGTSDKCRE